MSAAGWAFVVVIAAYAIGGAILDALREAEMWDRRYVRMRAEFEQRERATGFWTPTKGRER